MFNNLEKFLKNNKIQSIWKMWKLDDEYNYSKSFIEGYITDHINDRYNRPRIKVI